MARGIATRKPRLTKPAETPAIGVNGTSHDDADFTDTGLAVVEQPAEPLHITVKGFDFNAKGSLYGFLDLSDAQFRLQDAFTAEDHRGVITAMRELIAGLLPFLVVDDGEDLETELRNLSVNELFELTNAIKTHDPVPNGNAPLSPNGHKATARRRGG